MALTEAAKVGIWLKGFIGDLGLHHDYATMYCDSLSAICLAKDQVHHERCKRCLELLCLEDVRRNAQETQTCGWYQGSSKTRGRKLDHAGGQNICENGDGWPRARGTPCGSGAQTHLG